MLSPLLVALQTYTHPGSAILEFAGVGLISDGDETPYRTEIQRLVGWCAETNLVLSKAKKLMVDYRSLFFSPYISKGRLWRGCPSLEDMYNTWGLNRARGILKRQHTPGTP